MNRREMLILAAATSSALLFPIGWLGQLIAVEPSLDAPVTVTRTDRTIVRGTITAYDREKITIDVTTKPADPAVSTDIPWDQISRISNGLTREHGLRKWKADNHDSLCATCHGDAKTFCPTCHGTSHDPVASVGCPVCKGAAHVVCKTPKCDHGTIPCTNQKCLKLTDGGWVKKPDGLLWKKFSAATSSVEVSEHHIGEVIDKVDGVWADTGKCPVCFGVTKMPDPVCRGTGDMPCPLCSKKAKSPPCPDKCDGGLVPCPTCKGTGLNA